MSNILVNSNGTTAVATNTISRDSTTEHMQMFNLSGTDGSDAVGTDASGVSPATGGSGIRGWLSTIAKTLSGTLQIAGSISNFPAAQGPGANGSGTGQFVPVADTSAAINAPAAATTQLVAGVTGKSIRVCGFDFIANGTGSVQLVYGASNTPLTGAYPVTAETGISRGNGIGAVLIVPAGQNLSIITTGAGNSVQGSISYTQY